MKNVYLLSLMIGDRNELLQEIYNEVVKIRKKIEIH